MFKEELTKAAAEYGISLNDTQMEQYNRYFELLVEWNEKINLTAITEPKEVAIKHMIDSITAYDENLFKDGTTVIDVGTGAGFPGLPLKIFCPEIKLTLMDSLNKRIKFLQTVVEELGLKDRVRVLCVSGDRDEIVTLIEDGEVEAAVVEPPETLASMVTDDVFLYFRTGSPQWSERRYVMAKILTEDGYL